MPELTWDPADFLTCLAVEPEIEEYVVAYHYCVAKEGLVLNLSVFPLSSDVDICVRLEATQRAIIEFSITDCSGTRYVNDARGEFLEFAPSQVFGSRFEREFVIPVGVRLSVKPGICVQLFLQPA